MMPPLACRFDLFIARHPMALMAQAGTRPRRLVWIVCAIPGRLSGVRLRRLFGMANATATPTEGMDDE
ncbi:hypothetical protein [Denitromonas sp.]|uniref:hypothetical protein n=1 Tax=Denitromonas sp. TaxID=2734609 RepID=UPI003A8A376E